MSTSTPIPGAHDAATIARPPRDELFRAISPGIEFREIASDDGADDGPLLVGHFSRFDEWTTIDSFFEGRFLERIAPGAFKKTLREQTPKVLFNHGRDVTLGGTILGAPEVLREDDQGAYYEVRLFDGLPDLLMEGLRAGAYGASFKFRVVREELVQEPKRSAYNPDRLPERTITEAQVFEFGPVTFPAYEGASAGVRSLTDTFTFERLARDETALATLIEFRNGGAAPSEHPADEDAGPEVREQDDASPTDSAAAEPHPVPGRSVTAPLYGATTQRHETWRL